MTTIYDKNEQMKKKYNTKNNTKEMFPVGSRVKAICVYQDGYFFYPDDDDTYGTVDRIGLSGMIMVKWDVPKQYPEHLQKEFNFDPEDLILIEKENKMTVDEALVEMDDTYETAINLRENFILNLRLPKNLKEQEAQRIAAFLYALCIKEIRE